MKFGKKISKPSYISFIRCAALSALVLPIVSLIGAIIANASSDPTGAIGIASLVSVLVSAAISGIVCVRICPADEGVRITALCALFITLVMMIIGLICNRGALPFSGIMNYICYITTYIFASVMARRRGPGAGRRGRHR